MFPHSQSKNDKACVRYCFVLQYYDFKRGNSYMRLPVSHIASFVHASVLPFVSFKPHAMMHFLHLGRFYLDEGFSSWDVIRETSFASVCGNWASGPSCVQHTPIFNSFILHFDLFKSSGPFALERTLQIIRLPVKTSRISGS